MARVYQVGLEKVDKPDDGFVVHDVGERVPTWGTWGQLLTDDQIWGKPRQILEGKVEKFDFPQVVNKKSYNGKAGWDVRRRDPFHDGAPNFLGREYSFISMPDWCYRLIFDGIKWAANNRLEEGRVVRWIEKRGISATGRVSLTPPVRQEGDGGWYAVVEPQASYLWAYNELVGDGKALTDAGNREFGMADPIIPDWNAGAKNYEWLVAPFGGNVVEIVEQYGGWTGIGVIDVNGRPWTWDEVLDKRRYTWTNTITRTKLPNGRYATDDFPSVSEALKPLGLPRVGTPIPLFGRGDRIWVRRESVTVLEPGAPVSSYYPAKT